MAGSGKIGVQPDAVLNWHEIRLLTGYSSYFSYRCRNSRSRFIIQYDLFTGKPILAKAMKHKQNGSPRAAVAFIR
jgi:hypothetical protein